MSGQSGAQNNTTSFGNRQLTNDTISQSSVGVAPNLQMSQQMIGNILTAQQYNQMKIVQQKSQNNPGGAKSGLSYKKRMQNQNNNAQQKQQANMHMSQQPKKQTSYSQ